MWLTVGRGAIEVVFTHEHGYRHQHDQFYGSAADHELAHRLERFERRLAPAPNRPR